MPAKVTIAERLVFGRRRARLVFIVSALLLGASLTSSSVIPAKAGTHVAYSDNGSAPLRLRVAQDTGAKLYSLTCITCHKANGLGIPDSVPPLAESEWATGSPARMLRIVLGGMQGEIEVQGEFFNAAMPGWGGTLNDFDIAAVTTYVRKSWGNKGSAITAETVAQIRKATLDRKTPWTAEELRRISGDR